MNVDELLEYLTNTPGVIGNFVGDPFGKVIAKNVPPIYADDTLSMVAREAGMMISVFDDTLEGCNELVMKSTLVDVYIKDVSPYLLILFVESGSAAKASNFRLAANMVAKQIPSLLGSGSQPITSSTPVATAPGISLGKTTNQAPQSPPPAKKVVKKVAKKKKSSGGDSIWG